SAVPARSTPRPAAVPASAAASASALRWPGTPATHRPPGTPLRCRWPAAWGRNLVITGLHVTGPGHAPAGGSTDDHAHRRAGADDPVGDPGRLCAADRVHPAAVARLRTDHHAGPPGHGRVVGGGRGSRPPLPADVRHPRAAPP